MATAGGASIVVFLTQPDGALSAPVSYEGCDGETVSLVDVDGDGDLDVIASNGFGLVVFQNDGQGSLQLGATFPTTGHADAQRQSPNYWPSILSVPA